MEIKFVRDERLDRDGLVFGIHELAVKAAANLADDFDKELNADGGANIL